MQRVTAFSMAIALLILPGFLSAEDRRTKQDDITFIVAGKTSNHRQDVNGAVTVLNYHFFAEIFLQPDGAADPAGIITPLSEGQVVAFADSGYAMEMHGGLYRTEQELESAYPDGNYIFRYTTPSTGAVRQSVPMGNPNSDSSGLPAAPRIYLSQNGNGVEPGKINPDLNLVVTWSEFEDGGSDPLGIMDDLLFVILGDCEGVRRAHSGRPFENTPYLSYADRQFVISADTLLPENIYQLSVEHAILDTGIEHGVTAFATFASTTFLDIHTLGKAQPDQACNEVRKNFDAGQAILD